MKKYFKEQIKKTQEEDGILWYFTMDESDEEKINSFNYSMKLVSANDNELEEKLKGYEFARYSLDNKLFPVFKPTS